MSTVVLEGLPDDAANRLVRLLSDVTRQFVLD